MALDQNKVEQAISSFEDLVEVLSKLIIPIHGLTPLYLTTVDFEVISSSRSNLHRFLLETQSKLGTGNTGTETETEIDSGNAEEESGCVSIRAEEIEDMRSENERNRSEIEALQNEVRELRSHDRRCTSSDTPTALELVQTKQELSRCKETLHAMKSDRRRLRSDKADLVSQMKQLYNTLEDKEAELREFIRSYDQRMNEISTDAKKMEIEKEEMEKTKNLVLNECRILKAKLEITCRQSNAITNPEKTALDKAVRNSFSDESVLKLASTDGHCSSSGDDLPPYQEIYVLDMSNPSPTLPRAASVSEGHLTANMRKAFQKSSQLLRKHPGSIQVNNNSPRKDLNLLRKVSTAKTASESSQRNSTTESQNASRVSFLSPENFEEKLRAISEAKELPAKRWRVNHVLSWLELEMNMPMYGTLCAANIKSGKVLLEMSDSDLDSALRLQPPLHRRKLRLAIEELRHPSTVGFPSASKISHVWVSLDWIVSLGLPQYSRTFEEQLVDGRMLSTLTKKDLDKYLNIHKKFHQSSIVYGIELLRSLDFSKEQLQDRRIHSREHFSDPLVWSNEQIIEWANHIDLAEYSQSLKETGVHGAVLVFDQSFTSDVFASMLGIPMSKSYVRRHLSTELEAIIRPARAAIEESRSSTTRSPATNSSFRRSFSGGNRSDAETQSIRGTGSGRKLSFRGSLGRVFSRRSVKGLSLEGQNLPAKSSSNSDLSRPSTSKPVPAQ